MMPTVNSGKAKQRVTKKTVVQAIAWFVILGAVLTLIAFAGHL